MERGPQSELTAARLKLAVAEENLRVLKDIHPPDAQRIAKAEVGVAKAEVGFAKAEWQRADAVEKERYWFLVEEASKLVEDARKVFDTANTAHRDALAAAKAAAASAAAPAGYSTWSYHGWLDCLLPFALSSRTLYASTKSPQTQAKVQTTAHPDGTSKQYSMLSLAESLQELQCERYSTEGNPLLEGGDTAIIHRKKHLYIEG
uniref:Uncharacterized protein n=1 Tax=Hemiselmis andersenii TaxID=464988 RepID=A0A7S1E1N1_HEMAN|mmetsp:Transcript_34084/g.83000  ORF Transcript_34084/g.83000 Transcript_34084/m.83000 type:complete len:204 (+) Transcript_34084:61-672(+)